METLFLSVAHRFDYTKIQFLSLVSGTLFLNGDLSQIENKNITMFLSLGNGDVMTVLTFPSDFIFGRSCINRPCCQSQVF